MSPTDPFMADDWGGFLEPDVERLRMAFAEAGYPDAHVYVEASGIFVEGVPEAVQERAFDLVNAVPNQGPLRYMNASPTSWELTP